VNLTGDVVVLADSINIAGNRLTTLLLRRFPYALLQEPATHRLLHQDGLDEPLAGDINPFTRWVSRSTASSRAIPIERAIQRTLEDPYVPRFTKAAKGMSGAEVEDPEFQAQAEAIWRQALGEAVERVRQLSALGVHKQDANHLLKPWMRIPILVTATEWQNFFSLRTAKPCHPGFRQVALEMQKALQTSKPKLVEPGGWHIPFGEGLDEHPLSVRLRVAAARAARISYATHDGVYSLERDLDLAARLLADGHMSPFEHAAQALSEPLPQANLRGWRSVRTAIEAGELQLN